MSPGSTSLLRALAGGVSPADARGTLAPSPGRETLDFARMLSRARGGELRTGLPVGVPFAIRADIDRSTGEGLSAATDEAAAMGIDRALVLVGNRAFRVDVGARMVIDAPRDADRTISGIDGLVRVPASGAPGSPASSPDAATGPARVVRNASLLNTLAGPDAR